MMAGSSPALTLSPGLISAVEMVIPASKGGYGGRPIAILVLGARYREIMNLVFW